MRQCSALGHERRGAPRERDKRVSAHVVRPRETLRGSCLQNSPSSASFGAKGDGVQKEMQPAEFLARFVEHTGDVIIFGLRRHSTAVSLCRTRRQVPRRFLEPFTLISEGECGARLVPGLRDGPGDGAFVGDTEDDSEFARRVACSLKGLNRSTANPDIPGQAVRRENEHERRGNQVSGAGMPSTTGPVQAVRVEDADAHIRVILVLAAATRMWASRISRMRIPELGVRK